jgi:hypothetical protein
MRPRLALIAALALSVSACGDAVELRMPGEGRPFGISLPEVSRDDTVLVGSIPLCVSSPDAVVTVTAVAPVSEAVTVQRFDIRRHDSTEGTVLTGGELGELNSEGGTTVTVPCEPSLASGAVNELVLQVSHGGGASTTDGIRVTYAVEGGGGTLLVPLLLSLCSGDAVGNGCREDG